jgi:hypothetical protein
MIQIIKGKVFLDGVQTINPELIGYAMLDFAEDNLNKTYNLDLENSLIKDVFIKKYDKYIQEKGLRKTYERSVLISLICEMPNNFKALDFVQKSMLMNISYATGYTFLKKLSENGFISLNERTYSFNINH